MAVSGCADGARRRSLISKGARTAGSIVLLSMCARSEPPVEWSAEPAAAAAVKAGSIISLRVRAKIDRGWYVYSITQPPGGPVGAALWLPEGQSFSLGGLVSGTAPEVGFDRVFGITVEKYRGTAEFIVPVQVSPGAVRGRQAIQLHVRYQACNDEICLPPRIVKLSPSVSVSPG